MFLLLYAHHAGVLPRGTKMVSPYKALFIWGPNNARMKNRTELNLVEVV